MRRTTAILTSSLLLLGLNACTSDRGESATTEAVEAAGPLPADSSRVTFVAATAVANCTELLSDVMVAEELKALHEQPILHVGVSPNDSEFMQAVNNQLSDAVASHSRAMLLQGCLDMVGQDPSLRGLTSFSESFTLGCVAVSDTSDCSLLEPESIQRTDG